MSFLKIFSIGLLGLASVTAYAVWANAKPRPSPKPTYVHTGMAVDLADPAKLYPSEKTIPYFRPFGQLPEIDDNDPQMATLSEIEELIARKEAGSTEKSQGGGMR
jgi:hypothetical protein